MEKEEDSQSYLKDVSQNQKLFLTLALYFLYFNYGIDANVLPVASAEFITLIDSNVQDFAAYGLVALSLAYCGSALLGTYLSKYVNRQIYLLVSILILGTGQALLPFSGSLFKATILMASSGIGQAGVDVAANAFLLAVWRGNPKAPSLMQGMYFMFALGTTLAPLITQPFLAHKLNWPEAFEVTLGELSHLNMSTSEVFGFVGDMKNPNNITIFGTIYNASNLEYDFPESKIEENYNKLTETIANLTNNVEKPASRVHIPFFMSAGLYLLTIGIFALVHLMYPYDQKEEEMLVALNNEQDAESGGMPVLSQQLRRVILIIGAFILMFDFGAEMSTSNFNTIFVISSGYDHHKAAFIASARSICFALSRAAAAIAARRFPLRYILYVSITFNILGNLLIIFSSTMDGKFEGVVDNKKEIVLWVGFSFLGLGFGPLYPAIYSFVEKVVTLGTLICGLFVFTASFSAVLDYMIVGKYIEGHANILVYHNLISAFGVAILFAVLDYLVRKIDVGVKSTKM